MSTAYSPNVPIAQGLMREVIAVMSSLGDHYAPPMNPNSAPRLGGGLQDFGLTSAKLDALRTTYEAWPKGILPAFHQASEALAQVLQMFGAPLIPGRIDLNEAMLELDPTVIQLLSAAKRPPDDISSSGDSRADVVDPAVMRRALLAEAERHAMKARTPFAATVTTMLGPDALRWLFAPNSDESPYLQPHEFSRAGWIRLTRVRDQIAIEQELARFYAEHAAHTKIVVCLVWTVAALASLMEDSVFLTERDAFVSSLRGDGLTLSVGIVNHTIVNFSVRSMRCALRILHEGLTNELMTACDLMWIANGVMRWRSVKAGYSSELPVQQEEFSVFLSHRGCDAKSDLALALLPRADRRRVFLDCLTLPHGVINRSFVFGALGRARRVVLVDSARFAESQWCLKELWFGEQLQKLGLTTLQRCSLAGAIQAVSGIEKSIEMEGDTSRTYPIGPQVLLDARYWARRPNLCSLEKIRPIPKPLQRAEGIAATGKIIESEGAASLAAREAVSLLDAAARESPRGEPLDVWASAVQLAVCILGANTRARSKMEVRARIDNMNAALSRMAGELFPTSRVFSTQASRFLVCLAAAVVSDLAGFHLDQFTARAVREAIRSTAILRDGLLLFDVRDAGPQRDFHLRFALELLKNDVSAVGILQSADDPVHELVFDGRSLEILPCVTLHPGMEALFPELPQLGNRTGSLA